MSSAINAEVRSLYLHVPFCERKCGYCDFASVNGKRREHDYVDALREEIRRLARLLPPLQLDTVFVGGGTPSFIEPRLLAGILEEAAHSFTIAAGAEVTLEANPSSINVERARTWRAAGFSRISIGVQSLDEACLRFLGRVHDSERAVAAVQDVRDAGFDSINCDLIYAVPGLDDDRWAHTLEGVIALHPAHISCYELTVEAGTPLHRAVQRGAVQPTSAEPALHQHWLAVDSLAAHGYRQYEVSNFAHPGRECRHNLTYWRNGWYVAAGVGAHGHVPASLAPALGMTAQPGDVATRYWHTRSVAEYIKAVAAGGVPVQGFEGVDAETRELERRMLGLRLAEGIEVDGEALPTATSRLVHDGLVTVDVGRLRATRRGQEVLDRVVTELCAAVAACNSGATRSPIRQTAG